jgi:hypothetical protein
MNKLISSFIILSSIFIFMGCAASYRPINPPTLNYYSNDFQDGVGFSYKYDVLKEKGNKKYAKKEDKRNIRIVAIKLINNTDTTINIGRDLLFYSGQNQLNLMDPLTIKNSIKQVVPGYLPYLFLTLLQLNVSDGQTVESYPIGLVIGPAITIGNMAVAGSSNTSLFEELNEYNIIFKDIKKGETVYGIIGIHDEGYNPITIKLKSK